MYTSSKRGYVNAFASRLLRVVSETILRDPICKDTYRNRSNRISNNKASRGRFSLDNGHGFESILRGSMEFEWQANIEAPRRRGHYWDALAGRARNLSPTLFLQIVPILRIFVSIRSSLSIGASSLARTHNGLPQSLRRCSRRVLSEQSDMTGC